MQRKYMLMTSLISENTHNSVIKNPTNIRHFHKENARAFVIIMYGIGQETFRTETLMAFCLVT
jgi:hypothetical protein